MSTLLMPVHFAWFLSALFAGAAVLHLAGPGFVREAYDRAQYPIGFQKVTGILLALAAIFLSMPLTRFWGIAIAAVLMFLTAITLINRRQYRYAAPLVALLFALVPASLASPV